MVEHTTCKIKRSSLRIEKPIQREIEISSTMERSKRKIVEGTTCKIARE